MNEPTPHSGNSEPMQQALSRAFIEILSSGNQIALPAFGTFGTVKNDEYTLTDYDTGVTTLYPPRITVAFTPALKLVKQIKSAIHE